jgi:hypothetical protein
MNNTKKNLQSLEYLGWVVVLQNLVVLVVVIRLLLQLVEL